MPLSVLVPLSAVASAPSPAVVLLRPTHRRVISMKMATGTPVSPPTNRPSPMPKTVPSAPSPAAVLLRPTHRRVISMKMATGPPVSPPTNRPSPMPKTVPSLAVVLLRPSHRRVISMEMAPGTPVLPPTNRPSPMPKTVPMPVTYRATFLRLAVRSIAMPMAAEMVAPLPVSPMPKTVLVRETEYLATCRCRFGRSQFGFVGISLRTATGKAPF